MRDIPHTLFTAIRSALLFLSFGELPKDERPARRIWTDGERLSAWFEEVERRREARMKGEGDIEGDVAENDAATLLIAG